LLLAPRPSEKLESIIKRGGHTAAASAAPKWRPLKDSPRLGFAEGRTLLRVGPLAPGAVTQWGSGVDNQEGGPHSCRFGGPKVAPPEGFSAPRICRWADSAPRRAPAPGAAAQWGSGIDNQEGGHTAAVSAAPKWRSLKDSPRLGFAEGRTLLRVGPLLLAPRPNGNLASIIKRGGYAAAVSAAPKWSSLKDYQRLGFAGGPRLWRSGPAGIEPRRPDVAFREGCWLF
jgi:hypothetical protein